VGRAGGVHGPPGGGPGGGVPGCSAPPPYRQGWIERIAPLLPAVLAAGARIYAEAERPIERIDAWRTARSGQAGQVFYHLLEAAQP
ncbi:MAG TPA: hypothetical protein PKC23_10780, partial [Candidatus Desulfobacillus sp.]|nr:hypothetical protein [Candidatus Desulfobacillus sp.]